MSYSKRVEIEVTYGEMQAGDYIYGQYDEIWEVLWVIEQEDRVDVELWRPTEQHRTVHGRTADRAVVYRLPEGVVDEGLRTRVSDRRYSGSTTLGQEDYRDGYKGTKRLPRITW